MFKGTFFECNLVLLKMFFDFTKLNWEFRAFIGANVSIRIVEFNLLLQDDKLRIERNSLKTALDTNHATEMQRAVENAKKDAKHEFKNSEKNLKEENDKLQQQIQTLNKDIEALRTQMTQAINDAIKEGDKKAFEERKRASAHTEHHQEEMDKIKDDFNGQISRLRVEYDEKVEDLEKRLEVALGKAENSQKKKVFRDYISVN